AEAHAERGRILHEQRRYFEALRAYEAALRLGPDKAEFYWWKHEALLALHRQPIHPCLVTGDLGLLISALQHGSLPVLLGLPIGSNLQIEAAAALDQYVAKGGPPRAEVYQARGRLRVRLQQLPLAIADYTEALRLQ